MNSIVGGLVGGSLIGFAAVTLLLGYGEIMGSSSILIALLTKPKSTATTSSQKWRVLFLAGFFLTANVLHVRTQTLNTYYYDDDITNESEASSNEQEGGEYGRMLLVQTGPFVSNFGIVIAGLFTGFGAKLGNGCTTGHGICGMARMSRRSIIGSVTFMSMGFVTSSILSTNVGLFRGTTPLVTPNILTQLLSFMMVGLLLYTSFQILHQGKTTIFERITRSSSAFDDKDEEAPVASSTPMNESSTLLDDQDDEEEYRKMAPYVIISGILFAGGLEVSRMIDNKVILDFLDITGFWNGTWDPTLALVMGSGVIVSGVGYQFVEGYSNLLTIQKPLQCTMTGRAFQIPQRKEVDTKLSLGASAFGFGWGVGGYCPGPALYLACVGYPQIMFLFMPMFAIGALIAQLDVVQRSLP